MIVLVVVVVVLVLVLLRQHEWLRDAMVVAVSVGYVCVAFCGNVSGVEVSVGRKLKRSRVFWL